MAAPIQRILSGVKPSGEVHLGNYFGTMKQHIALQEIPNAERFYFIADFHAQTTVQDAERLRQYVMGVALDYLALDWTPKNRYSSSKATCGSYRVGLAAECRHGMGLLERAHAYKDKIAKGLKPSMGLFYYPVLMAADILIYKSNLVPSARTSPAHRNEQDMAGYFNQTFKKMSSCAPKQNSAPSQFPVLTVKK